MHGFSEKGKPLRLEQRSVAQGNPAPKPIPGYRLYLPELEETWLRFVDGRPVSGISTRVLEWCSEKLVAAGKKVLVLVWAMPLGTQAKKCAGGWIREHNRKVKKGLFGA